MVADPAADTEEIDKLVKTYISNAGDARIHGKEISFTLPIDSVEQFSG